MRGVLMGGVDTMYEYGISIVVGVGEEYLP